MPSWSGIDLRMGTAQPWSSTRHHSFVARDPAAMTWSARTLKQTSDEAAHTPRADVVIGDHNFLARASLSSVARSPWPAASLAPAATQDTAHRSCSPFLFSAARLGFIDSAGYSDSWTLHNLPRSPYSQTANLGHLSGHHFVDIFNPHWSHWNSCSPSISLLVCRSPLHPQDLGCSPIGQSAAGSLW